jgi:hypothetical protein
LDSPTRLCRDGELPAGTALEGGGTAAWSAAGTRQVGGRECREDLECLEDLEDLEDPGGSGTGWQTGPAWMTKLSAEREQATTTMAVRETGQVPGVKTVDCLG